MPRLMSALVAVLVALGGLSSATARADELGDYELARNRYDQGKWEEAIERFDPLLDPANPNHLKDEKLRFEAIQMHAASLVSMGRVDEGKREIAVILREDPTYNPTPGLYPQAYIDRVIEVRGELREELERIMRERIEAERERERLAREAKERERLRVARLEELASEETVVESRSRWIALIPFGVGQFQNDDAALGWTFAASEVLALTSTVVSAGLAQQYASAGADPGCELVEFSMGQCVTQPEKRLDRAQLASNLDAALAVQWVSFGSTVALAVAGIIEAQVSFEEDAVTTRQRELPAELRAAPTVSVTGDGLFMGAVGTF